MNASNSIRSTSSVNEVVPSSSHKRASYTPAKRSAARSGNVKPKELPAFATHGPRLLERGYAPLPIVPATKRPVPDGWSAFSTAAPTPHQIELWSMVSTYGVGVVCGFAGLVGIDIDAEASEVQRALYAALPHTDVRKKGAKGETLFYRAIGLPSRSFNITNRDNELNADGSLKMIRAVDVISAGRQTLLPPTLHPDTGRPYVWTGPLALEDVDPADLPSLPENVLDTIAEALKPFGYEEAEERQKRATDDGEDADTWFRRLNSESLERLADWVPALGLHKCAEVKGKGYEAVAAWRSSSTGQPLGKRKRNLKIHHEGIRDFGAGGHDRGVGYTPIDLVMAHRVCDRSDAIEYLCQALGRDTSGLNLAGLLGKLDCDPASHGQVAVVPVAAAPTNSGKPADANSLASRKVDFRGYVALSSVERKEFTRDTEKPNDFPLQVLPAELREAIEASVELSQAPAAMAADVALTAISVSAHGVADVMNRATTNVHPLSLFVMTLGVSGERKSTLNKILMRPIHDRESQLRKEYLSAREVYVNDLKVWESEEQRILRNPQMDMEMIRALHRQHVRAKPTKPRKHTIVHTTPTLEGLKRELRDAQLAGAILNDEGGSFLGSHAMGRDRLMETITSLSKMWDGDGFKHGRAKEEDSYECRGRRVAMGLMVQPAVAKDFLADELVSEQGFLPRILVSFPATTIGTRVTRAARAGTDPRLTRYYDQLAALLTRQDVPAVEAPTPEKPKKGNLSNVIDRNPATAPEADELTLPVIDVREGSTAWEMWANYCDTIEREMAQDREGVPGRYSTMTPTAGKSGEQALRIAGCLHLFAGGAADGELSADAMHAGITIAQYYLDEALRLQGGVVVDAEEKALVRLSEFLRKHTDKRTGRDKLLFTPRVIRKDGPIETRHAEKLRDRLAQLVKFGHIAALAKIDGKGNHVDDPIMVDGKACREVYAYVPTAA